MKTFKSLTLAIFILLSVQSQQSKAALTLVAPGPAGYAAFELMMLPLGVGGYYLSGECRMDFCVDKVLALASLSIGLVLLDKNTSELSFGEITDSRAKQLGLTKDEQEAFNSQLEEINFLKDDMIEELSTMKNPTLDDANRMWNQSQDILEKNAFIALTKVRNSFQVQ